MLETMMVGAAPVAKEDNAFGGAVSLIVKDFKENHTDTTVLFTVTITQGVLDMLSIISLPLSIQMTVFGNYCVRIWKLH
jgi:hypothetical protein